MPTTVEFYAWMSAHIWWVLLLGICGIVAGWTMYVFIVDERGERLPFGRAGTVVIGAGAAAMMTAFVASAAGVSLPVTDGAVIAQVASMPAASMKVPEADPVPAEQAVSDGKTRITRDGHIVLCDSTGQAFEITGSDGMTFSTPIWKAGKPLKCRRDMFVSQD